MPMQMQFKKEMTIEQRLEQMEVILVRICGELDVCFRLGQQLLILNGAKEKAQKLSDEFETLRTATMQAADEIAAAREATTIPPPDETK